MTSSPRSLTVRFQVVAAAVDLFEEVGFEATSVDEIARAAGISRSTYFRQVGGKEDAVFADHTPLLEELEAWMQEQVGGQGPAGDEGPDADPWLTVCRACLRVFAHLTQDLSFARRRYRIVRSVPTLREREIVTERRYEQLFSHFLGRAVPHLDPLDAVGFAAVVTATHNHLLRRLLRTEPGLPATEATAQAAVALETALQTLRARFGVGEGPDAGEGQQVVVAAFHRSVPTAEVMRRVEELFRADDRDKNL